MKTSASLRLVRVGSLAAVIAALLAVSSAPAIGATWDGGGADALWSTSLNWGSSPAPGAGGAAIFDATGNAKPAIDTSGGVSINSILYGKDAGAYAIGNQGAILLDNGGNITMNADVAANQTVNAAINVTSTGATISNASTTNSLTINGNISFADFGMALNKTGAGEVILTGTNWLNPDSLSTFGKLRVTGGGKLTITGATYASPSSGNKSSQSYDGNIYVGNDATGSGSGGNTLNVSGTGRLWSTGLNLGGYGGATYPNSFGNNTVNLSAPGPSGTPTFYDWQQGGEGPATTCIGNSSDYNVVNVTNGACFRFANGGSGMVIGNGAAAGSGNHNGMNLDGFNGGNRSQFYSSGRGMFF